MNFARGSISYSHSKMAPDTYHGLRRKHIDPYHNEFVFRYNRRFFRHASFETILGLAAHREPASYWGIVGRTNPRKGNPALRRAPRRRKTATGMRQDSPRRAQANAQNHVSETGQALDMVEPGTTG